MSCLFNSLGSLLNVDPAQLRQDVCDYFAKNPVVFDDGTRASDVLEWESDLPASVYVTRMRDARTWGGGPEIFAVCELTGTPVYVHDSRDLRKVIEFVPQRCRSRRGLHVEYNGFHYEPLGKK